MPHFCAWKYTVLQTAFNASMGFINKQAKLPAAEKRSHVDVANINLAIHCGSPPTSTYALCFLWDKLLGIYSGTSKMRYSFYPECKFGILKHRNVILPILC